MAVRDTLRLGVILAGLMVSGGLAGATPAQAAGANDPLQALRSAWVHALQSRDLEGSVALFEPDALFLAPDGGRFPDRASIRTLYKSVFAAYQAAIALESRRRICSGTLCVDQGSYVETLTATASGGQLKLRGEYVLVARRQTDKSWKIAEMVWAGDTPTAGRSPDSH